MGGREDKLPSVSGGSGSSRGSLALPLSWRALEDEMLSQQFTTRATTPLRVAVGGQSQQDYKDYNINNKPDYNDNNITKIRQQHHNKDIIQQKVQSYKQ